MQTFRARIGFLMNLDAVKKSNVRIIIFTAKETRTSSNRMWLAFVTLIFSWNSYPTGGFQVNQKASYT